MIVHARETDHGGAFAGMGVGGVDGGAGGCVGVEAVGEGVGGEVGVGGGECNEAGAAGVGGEVERAAALVFLTWRLNASFWKEVK